MKIRLLYNEEKFRPFFIGGFLVTCGLLIIVWIMWFFNIGMLRDKIYITIFFLLGLIFTIIFYILHRNGNFVFKTSKDGYYIHRVVGYGLTICAFLATIVSFIPGIAETKDKVYLIILFILTLIVSFIYDGLAKKYNNLLITLDNETKNLINSYNKLKEFEINESYNRAFSDFTRYTNYVSGVQVYNYHLLPKLNGGSIKIEYETGSMQEGVNINAIIQNYYDYKLKDVNNLKEAIFNLRINNDFESAINLLKKYGELIKENIKKEKPVETAFDEEIRLAEKETAAADAVKDKSIEAGSNEFSVDYSLIAIWLILVEEIIYFGKKVNKQVPLEELKKMCFDDVQLPLNKNIGLFKFILYSDILKLKSREVFDYSGTNPLKKNRKYIAVKAVSNRGVKKIFLIIVDTADFNVKSINVLIDSIINKLLGILNSNNLFKTTYTISNGEGEAHDDFKKIIGFKL